MKCTRGEVGNLNSITVLRTAFDMVWNAFALIRSRNHDKESFRSFEVRLDARGRPNPLASKKIGAD